MASDDVKKLVSEQMPGFEAVSSSGRPSATPDQQSRSADDWKAKLAGGSGDDRPTKRPVESAATDAPAPAPSRDAFFGSGDPRERLRSRASRRYAKTTDRPGGPGTAGNPGDPGNNDKTVIVQVRPTNPQPDSGRGVSPKAVVIKKGKIVGSQG